MQFDNEMIDRLFHELIRIALADVSDTIMTADKLKAAELLIMYPDVFIDKLKQSPEETPTKVIIN